MLAAFRNVAGHLERLAPEADLSLAQWVDLYRPLDSQVALLAGLGVAVPTLAEMEEIEISARLYHEGNSDVMTVVLPGLSTTKDPIAGPVTFILTSARLVTVRHHAPRPFDTYAEHAGRAMVGCATPDQILLGLVEECVARLADLLEGIGKALDQVSGTVFTVGPGLPPADLQTALQKVGREGDLLGRIRLGLLTLERMLSFYGQGEAKARAELRPAVKALMRDLAALNVHADFLGSRIGLASDATLGMINLAQNATVRIVSVVAALFLPPTLIASVYGMNFAVMPELATAWGYPMALGLMVASALFTYLYFKWKGWL